MLSSCDISTFGRFSYDFVLVLKEKDKNKLLEAADDRQMTQDTFSAEPYNQLSTLT